MIYNLFYVITYIFSMFYIKNFMTAFFGKNKTPKWIYYISHLIYPILVCTFYFTVNVPILNLMANITAIFIISLNYSSGISKRILFSVFLYIIMLAVEVGISFATGYFGVSVFQKGAYSDILGLVAIALILYLFSLILKKIRKKENEGNVKIKEWIAIFLIPILSLYLIIVLVESSDMLKYEGIITVTAIFAINIIVFYLYEGLQESYKNNLSAILFEHEKEYYYEQCKYMEASAESARSFRHDTKNHLLSIANHIKIGNHKEAEEYIYKIIGSKLDSKKTFSNTGNIAVDSVINFKLNEAEKNCIQVSADIQIPNNLLLDPSDITAIMGNLIDNAIEACLKLEQDKRRLTVCISYEKGRLFIEAENTFNGVISIRYGRITTLKSDKLNHGYGLKNVEKIMEKYDGFIDHNCKDGLFKITAIMYVKINVTV